MSDVFGGGTPIFKTVNGDASNATITNSGVTRTLASLANTIGIQEIDSIFDFILLTATPTMVYLNSWDGTDKTISGGGFFSLTETSTTQTMDGGVTVVTASGALYTRDDVSSVDPAYYGAIGDGSSHQLSNFFTTLADAQKIFPIVYSLKQEIDWVAIQTACNSGKGILSPARHYIMCNSDVASDDNPLVWISGTSFGDFTNSTLEIGRAHV